MTREEVDAFLAGPKTLPAAPTWRVESRSIERRAGLPIALSGLATSVKLNITIRMDDPAYLMLGISVPPQICRLCLTTGHRDRATKRLSLEAHFHSWEANRPRGGVLPKKLENAEPLPAGLSDRDAAFSWFLKRHMIVEPVWLPIVWASPGTLV